MMYSSASFSENSVVNVFDNPALDFIRCLIIEHIFVPVLIHQDLHLILFNNPEYQRVSKKSLLRLICVSFKVKIHTANYDRKNISGGLPLVYSYSRIILNIFRRFIEFLRSKKFARKISL
jgi:hypothetical protein